LNFGSHRLFIIILNINAEAANLNWFEQLQANVTKELDDASVTAEMNKIFGASTGPDVME
jgi:hypothetical protein